MMGLGVCLVLMGVVPGNAQDAPWRSPLGQDHPLVGRIWDVAAARFIDAAALVDGLAAARFVLLGEKHDNVDHHRSQAWVLHKLIDAGRRPVVGFEMFTRDDEAAIARYMAAHPKDAAGLGAAIDWSRRGWPDWAWYQPIADLALQHALSLVGADVPPAMARDIASQGLSILAPAQVQRWGLDRPLPPDIRQALAEDIRQAHCGHAPDTRVEAMVTMQRVRDAHMAARLVEAGQQDGAVLIAGAGHVRHDYGVPVYLGHQAPGATVLTVAFLEVSAERLEATAYADRLPRRTLPFDYVWFTPRVDDDDPCATFEEQLKKLRQ
jgi:uncharacterized iron-regulated protein